MNNKLLINLMKNNNNLEKKIDKIKNKSILFKRAFSKLKITYHNFNKILPRKQLLLVLFLFVVLHQKKNLKFQTSNNCYNLNKKNIINNLKSKMKKKIKSKQKLKILRRKKKIKKDFKLQNCVLKQKQNYNHIIITIFKTLTIKLTKSKKN